MFNPCDWKLYILAGFYVLDCTFSSFADINTGLISHRVSNRGSRVSHTIPICFQKSMTPPQLYPSHSCLFFQICLANFDTVKVLKKTEFFGFELLITPYIPRGGELAEKNRRVDPKALWLPVAGDGVRKSGKRTGR